MKSFFTFERKLKPKVKKRKQQQPESISEAKINIHIIRGTDIPVRTSFYDNFTKYLMAKEAAKGGRGVDADIVQMQYTKLYDNKQVEAMIEVRLYDPVN